MLLKVEPSESYHLGINNGDDLDRLLVYAGLIESQWLPSIAAAIIWGGLFLFLWFMSTLMSAPTS